MKTTLLTLIALAITVFSFGQAPEAFKYQAVVRDAGGAILTNQGVGYQLRILQGSALGTAVYTETFSPTTNNYGLVNIEIGTGTTVDDFSLIDWGNGPYYIETAIDVTGGTSYSVMGTSQMVSVPYALYSKSADSVVNDMVDDADADPNNEIQAMSFSNDTLYLSDGGQVYLGAYGIDLVDDADADPNNELQAISFSNDTLYLSNGGQIYLGAYGIDLVDDADNNPTNEIQDISLTGTDLSITGGSTVDLSTIQDGVNDADSDPTNELQTWSTLPGIPAGLNDGIDDVDDADNNPTNEIQDISLTGTDLSISGGSTVDLSAIQDGVNDADSDPANELQALSLSNDTLYLSNGNDVFLGNLQFSGTDVAFSARLDYVGNTAIPGNPFVFDIIDFNLGGGYNSTNGRFTAPTSGVYQFNITIRTAQSNIWVIRKNGTDYQRLQHGPSDSGGKWYMSSGIIMYLNQGEYVDIRFNDSNGDYSECCAGFTAVLRFSGARL